MLDVSKKIKTLRIATAQATLKVGPATVALVKEGKIPKGDALTIAKVAAIQAAKDTSHIIPYCHPLPVDFVGVDFELAQTAITVTVTVKAVYKTGVEMEALTAASVAALTMYDMLKMLDADMEIFKVKLLEKKGGKSDYTEKYAVKLRAAVLVTSDSVAAGKKDDVSGKLIAERLQLEGLEVVDYKVIPDDVDTIALTLEQYADEAKVDLVLTTGGTGFSPRDCTPEAMVRVLEREIPGIPEITRSYGQERTPYSMLSRGKAGIRGKTIIVNLPGSKKGVIDSLESLFPALLHAFKMLWGGAHSSPMQR
ncbi:MAG: bifunctional molybdenum cofactor biosynthesis protein MoaC/MoaB, partial [Candidatus Melainabacteria bacterium]|nr:bifunctional molybdenum cofactor biosynthesis protein MoaC/MoaB [Candidatus Melainabacteria bacterium]